MYILNLVRKEIHLVNLGLDERKIIRSNISGWNAKVRTRITDLR